MDNLHVIVGLGVTGFAVARYLQTMEVPIAVIDTRLMPPYLDVFQQTCPTVALKLGEAALADPLLSQASTIVLSPGISLAQLRGSASLKPSVSVIGDIELFARAVKALSIPVIAVSGSFAKSTVTTLVHQMLLANGSVSRAGGNLGICALDLLASPLPAIFVLEISSFQLETTFSLCPQVGAVLNVTADHMDRYDTFAEYQRTKCRIYQGCQLAVCNRDDPFTEAPSSVKQKVYFGLNAPNPGGFGILKQGKEAFLAFGHQCLLPVQALPVCGQQHQANALAALAIGDSVGLAMEPMLTVLRSFTGLPHRCQFVRRYQAVVWYNDSKGTNVGATCAAVRGLAESIQGKIILLAGGVGKQADFSPLIPLMSTQVCHLILMGEAAAEMQAVLAPFVSTTLVASLEEAVQAAKQVARAGDCVLLSPACASFDMFRNYEHRGEQFIQLVNALS